MKLKDLEQLDFKKCEYEEFEEGFVLIENSYNAIYTSTQACKNFDIRIHSYIEKCEPLKITVAPKRIGRFPTISKNDIVGFFRNGKLIRAFVKKVEQSCFSGRWQHVSANGQYTDWINE